MQITNNNSSLLSAFEQNKEKEVENTTDAESLLEKEIKEIVDNPAYKVSLSMNAEVILLALEASSMTKDNTLTQSDILSFLSGGQTSGGYDLESIGYTGTPITELSQEEAATLVGDDGFFGVTQTSDRVANFAIGMAGDNLEALEEARAGVVQGFEEAKKLFGGELPEISYQTQERTLALIDERIKALKNSQE